VGQVDKVVKVDKGLGTGSGSAAGPGVVGT